MIHTFSLSFYSPVKARVCLCRPGCPRTPFVDQSGLERRDLPVACLCLLSEATKRAWHLAGSEHILCLPVYSFDCVCNPLLVCTFPPAGTLPPVSEAVLLHRNVMGTHFERGEIPGSLLTISFLRLYSVLQLISLPENDLLQLF